MKIGRFAFLRPPLGDLGATYDDYLRLIVKRVLVISALGPPYECSTLPRYSLPVLVKIHPGILVRTCALQFPCNISLPICMECRRGLAMRILSVRQTRKIVTKRKKNLSRFSFHTKDHLA